MPFRRSLTIFAIVALNRRSISGDSDDAEGIGDDKSNMVDNAILFAFWRSVIDKLNLLYFAQLHLTFRGTRKCYRQREQCGEF